MTAAPPAVRLISTRGAISAQVVWDYLTNPLSTSPSEVPWRPEAVTTQWLTEVLRQQHPDAEVTGVEVIGGSDGTSSRRLLESTQRLSADEPLRRRRYLGKATPTLAHRLAFVRYAGNEVTFYRDVRPQLDLELPTSVYAGIDEKSGRSLVLLDDLNDTVGAHFCTWQDTLTKEQVLDAASMLASIHARFHYADDDGQEPVIRGVGGVEDFYGAAWIRSVEASHERAMEVAVDVVPADVMDRRDLIIPLSLRGAQIHHRASGTLLHSDPHLGNWYTTADSRMGLCDWQGLTRGHWSRDFAYSMSTLMTTAQRREWFDDVLDSYLETLGAKATGDLDRASVLVLVRQQLCNALLMWTATLVHPDWVPSMQPDAVSLAMISRITTAMSDMAALEAFDA